MTVEHSPSRCPLCLGAPEVVHRDHPGYIEGHTYSICRCRTCDASFAWPLATDPEVYDLIYRQPRRVPGYDLYARLAEEVRRHPDPLSLLARRHPTYWAIREHLTQGGARGSRKVVDYGCGLGYLTYALNRAGIDCVGVDLSRDAIDKARALYGDLYLHLDELAGARPPPQFDTVICLELIEHTVDPFTLLSAARQLVADGGELLLSSPNKAAYPPDALWATDAPPVHLWWFSPRSIEAVARRCGFSRCDFVDLTAFPRWDTRVPLRRDYSRPIVSPTFAADGRLRVGFSTRVLNRAAELALRSGMLDVLRRVRERPTRTQTSGQARYLLAVLKR